MGKIVDFQKFIDNNNGYTNKDLSNDLNDTLYNISDNNKDNELDEDLVHANIMEYLREQELKSAKSKKNIIGAITSIGHKYHLSENQFRC